MTRRTKITLSAGVALVLLFAICAWSLPRLFQANQPAAMQTPSAESPDSDVTKDSRNARPAEPPADIPDDWKKAHFGDAKQGPNDDPDGDGLTNLDEFRKGTDPTRPTKRVAWDESEVSVHVAGAEGIAGEGKRGPDGKIYFRKTYDRLYQQGKFKIPWDKLP